MEQFFARDYTGDAFEYLGAAHLAVIGLILLACISTNFLRTAKPPTRKAVRLGLALALILNETAWHVWKLAVGEWNIQTMLPLHLCNILVIANAVMLVTQNRTLYDFTFFALVAPILGIHTPDLGKYGFPHFRFFQTFASHGLILVAPIYMTVVERFRPTWKSLLRAMIILNIASLCVFIINLLIGSNYMFLAFKPTDLVSPLDYMGDWPWYVLGMDAMAFILGLLLYLPFAIHDRREKSPQKFAKGDL